MRTRLDAIMETVCEIENTSPSEIEQVSKRVVEDAIILEVGGDSRTLKKYLRYLRRFEYLQANNQWVFTVLKTSWRGEKRRIEDFK